MRRALRGLLPAEWWEVVIQVLAPLAAGAAVVGAAYAWWLAY